MDVSLPHLYNRKTANRGDEHEKSVGRDATANVVGDAVSVVKDCDGESPAILETVCIPTVCAIDVGPKGARALTLNFRDATRMETRCSLGRDFKCTAGLGIVSDLVCSCNVTLKCMGSD